MILRRDDDAHERPTTPVGAEKGANECPIEPTSYRMVAESLSFTSGSKSLLDDPRAMQRVPRRALSDERFRDALLDHREGFIVSLVDGRVTVEVIVDITGLPAAEALEVLEGLRLAGVLAFA